MERVKRLGRALAFPPVWLTAVLTPFAFGLLIYVFVQRLEETLLAYGTYALSAYATVILCVRAPGTIRAFRTGFQGHPLVRRALDSRAGSRYRSDALYRQEISLYAGLSINLCYAVIKLVSGVAYRSVWFGALAGYYLLLAVMRFALLHHVTRHPAGEHPISEWKRYRLCGGALLVMNQALAVVVFLVVRRSSSFVYPGMLIYVMALYTFYAFTVAIINMVKYRRHFSPVMSAAKAVSLVAALVSMLSLETAMLTQFGSAEDETFRRIMTGSTGAVVCIVVLALAISMIVRATGQIRALKMKQ